MQSLNSFFKALFIVLCNECSQSEFLLNICRDLYWSQSLWAAIVGRADKGAQLMSFASRGEMNHALSFLLEVNGVLR